MLGPWLDEEQFDEDPAGAEADAVAAARAALTASDIELIERYRELHQWRIDYHTRGAAREIAGEAASRAARTGTAVPGASRYPAALPDGYWPEISR